LISFTTEAGKYYRVEYSGDLLSPAWLTAVDMVPGTGGIVEVTHVGGAGQNRRYYRIRQLP